VARLSCACFCYWISGPIQEDGDDFLPATLLYKCDTDSHDDEPTTTAGCALSTECMLVTLSVALADDPTPGNACNDASEKPAEDPSE